jgi:HAD superfamily hydrolase (TIGR01490 family)
MDGGSSAMNEIPRRARNIGAFFDLDGTLLGGPSLERRLVRFLHDGKALGMAAAMRWLMRFMQELFAWRRGGFEHRWQAATDGNKSHLAGIRANTAETFAAAIARKPLGFFSGALRRLAWHVAQDHAVYLVTGSLGPLAVCAAWQLCSKLVELTGGKRPRIRVCATELDKSSGRWTGEVAGGAMCGAAKARAMERIAREEGIDLRRSYAYGDRWSDRQMFEAVGHPAAVNPSTALARLARRRGWTTLHWMDGEQKTPHGEQREKCDFDVPEEKARPAEEAVAVAARVGRAE